MHMADTHIGASATEGFMMQPRQPQCEAALYGRLRRWIAENDVDFVVHGGDMVDRATIANIEHATDLYASLDVPALLCPGNHDVTEPDAIDLWRRSRHRLFPDAGPTFGVQAADVGVFVLAHHWDTLDPPHYWDRTSAQKPLVDDGQRSALDAFCARATTPVVLVLHAPVNPIPATQTGLDHDIHVPDDELCALVRDVAERHTNIKLVMSGHNHANTASDHGPVVSMTTASFSETPFDARVVSATDGVIEVRTVSFAEMLGESFDYNPDQAWVQGSPADRELTVRR